jgi:VWFA-related protein
MENRYNKTSVKRVVSLLLISAAGINAQTGNEIAQKDAGLIFRSQTNVVSVPVVVRERSGKAVEGLTEASFAVFDKGKSQRIERVSVFHPGDFSTPAEAAPEGTDGPVSKSLPIPGRFVIYLFDDVHLSNEDLIAARDAARRSSAQSIRPTDRIALFTASGVNRVDFTGDLRKFNDALAALRTRPRAGGLSLECPSISDYQADLIVNREDPLAINTAVTEGLACGSDPRTIRESVRAMASSVLQAAEFNSQVTLRALDTAVARLSSAPGERSLVFISPGSLRTADQIAPEMEIIERAIRSGVIISALDARGLYVGFADASQHFPAAALVSQKSSMERQAASAQSELMAELAAGTGGSFFHNSNDLERGLHELTAMPDVWYVIAYSPGDMRTDGSWHPIKVELRDRRGLQVTARTGYYAPRHQVTAEEQTKEELRDAVFSRSERRDIPVTVHTEYFKTSDDGAKLAVITRFDVRQWRFQDLEGRHAGEATVVTALFDRDGRFVEASAKTVEMKLRDETLHAPIAAALPIRSEFNLTPGIYAIRVVVRDQRGPAMAAHNSAVEIP